MNATKQTHAFFKRSLKMANAKMLSTALCILCFNTSWGQWVEKITGEPTFTTTEYISCPDESTCYVVTSFVSTSSSKILLSTDGGDTWIDRTSNLPASTNFAGPIDCTSPTTCFCVCAGSIYKTADSGQTWTAVSNKNGYVEMIDAQYGYMLNGAQYEIHKTDDFGNTWNTFSFLSGIPFNVQDLGTKVDFVTPDVGIMAFHSESRNAEELYKTTNGGLNWTKVFDTINPPANYLFNSIDMVSLQVGYAVTTISGDIFKTTDGGDTWFYQTSVAAGGLDVAFIDEKNGYISGTSKVFKTIDGGENWIEEVVPTLVTDIEIVNYDVVYLGSTAPNIFKNSNAGLIAGIFDLQQNHIGKIYPNPATQKVVIEIEPQSIGATFELYDLLGKRLATQELNAVSTEFEKTDLPTGAYLFQIKKNNAVLGTGKLVFN